MQLGLAAALCEPEALMETRARKARAMLKVAPLALTEMKRLLRLGADAALPTALALEQEVLFRLYCSDDGQEGIDAFLEKRASGSSRVHDMARSRRTRGAWSPARGMGIGKACADGAGRGRARAC